MSGIQKAHFYGVVQGVGFRPTVYRIVKAQGLKGFIRNRGSFVELVISGTKKELEGAVSLVKKGLPPLARLDRVEIMTKPKLDGDDPDPAKLEELTIVASKPDVKDAPIPPDTATCPRCLEEILREEENRRFNYPFTNCTDCGARFSIITDMPYDRANTSMQEFEICEHCRAEYSNPGNRRFHAQTLSCGEEGVRYSLFDARTNPLNVDDPVAAFARMMEEGKIGVIKGWGGMHIACKLERIKALRDWYKRPYKPFALMVRDIATAERYAVVTDQGRKLLSSGEVPIVVLQKRETYEDEAVANAVEEASPGLGNIGIFVPYSGVQHILFKHLKDTDALVMTSANPADEPMLLGKREAFKLRLDCYLMHNRRIINRVDDSLVVPLGDKGLYVRRSRGLVPGSIDVPYKATVVSVGAEQAVTSSVSKNGKLYTSQYIGDSSNYSVMQFLGHATRYLMKLLDMEKPDIIAMDLHPQYPTRRFAEEMATSVGIETKEVQHHWAHAASLMVDAGKGPDDRMVVMAMDGNGYGPDRTVWGCEVLDVSFRDFERVGSLDGIRLIGGDKAVEDPRRLVFAVQERLGINGEIFRRDQADLMRKVMKNAMKCSSMGRLLDALSCRLGICTKRTYEGEPAMKLEPYLARGEPKFEFRTEVLNKDIPLLNTIILFEQLEQHLKRPVDERAKADIAHSFVKAVIVDMVGIASERAAKLGAKDVGLTGGVAYNLVINSMVQEALKAKDLGLVTHGRIPCGDGGISTGQNAIAGMGLEK